MCVDLGMLILDIYSQHMGESPQIDRLMSRLHITVRKEVEKAQMACQTEGMLGLLVEEY